MASTSLTLQDHALAAAKAAINFVPVVGGPIASLVSDYVPTYQQRAQAEACEALNQKLASLSTRIDSDAVNKADFADLYLKYQATISRTTRREKLTAAANILANMLLKPGDSAKSSYEELDHMLGLVDRLSVGAITALGAARKVTTSPGERNRFHFQPLQSMLPGWDQDFLLSCVMELSSAHLLTVQTGAINTTDFNGLINITPLGLRFASKFIEGSM